MKFLINNFLRSQTHLSESSKKIYRARLSAFSKFVGDNPQFEDEEVKRFLDSERFNALKVNTQNHYKAVLRLFLKHLKREYEYVRRRKNTKEVIRKEDLPTDEEVRKLLSDTPRAMDKCLIWVFLRGARLGEARHVRLKDVVDKNTHYVINVTKSKTQQRPLIVIEGAPYLRDWLNQHPDNDNPEQYLFCHKQNGEIKQYSPRGLQRIIERNDTVEGKKLHPHLFRHAAATKDYRYYREKEMLSMYGWKTRAMIDVYAHLNEQEDIELKSLQLHGLAPKEPNEKPLTITERKACPMCKTDNPATHKFCLKCGRALGREALEMEKDLELAEQFTDAQKEQIFEILMDALKERKKRKKE